MTDYIPREAAIENVLDQMRVSKSETTMRERLLNMEAADVRPVVRGKWRQIGPKEAVCSVCNNVTLTNGIDRTGHANIHNALYHFCPNCGADMREES